MKLSLLLLSFIFLIVKIDSKDHNNKDYKIVCYYSSWTYSSRDGAAKFSPEDINPNLCTHVMYAFAVLSDNNTMEMYDPTTDTGSTDWTNPPWGLGFFQKINDLRKINPHLTTMISLGGWNEGSDKYSKMVSNESSRKIFVDSVVKFLKKYEFDGLDLDWEYPAMKAGMGGVDRTPGVDSDKENYVKLLSELHSAFKQGEFLLSAAVGAGKPVIDRAYDVKRVNELLDFINVMTYDFHGGWEETTAHNSPLYPRPNATEKDLEYTVEYAIDYWVQLGAEPKKITMGIPLYGRTFTLASPQETGVGAKTVGTGGREGHFTHLPGTLAYYEVCELLKTNEWKIFRDDIQKIPYAVKDNQWIGFDDEESIKFKVEFLKSKGLGGAMVWSVETDDFYPICSQVKYPLLKTINEELSGVAVPSEAPVIHTTEIPDTYVCTSSGLFADAVDKTIYHDCIDIGNNKFRVVLMHCPPKTVFDQSRQNCA